MPTYIHRSLVLLLPLIISLKGIETHWLSSVSRVISFTAGILTELSTTHTSLKYPEMEATQRNKKLRVIHTVRILDYNWWWILRNIASVVKTLMTPPVYTQYIVCNWIQCELLSKERRRRRERGGTRWESQRKAHSIDRQHCHPSNDPHTQKASQHVH